MIGRTLWNNSWVKVRECYNEVEAEDERRILCVKVRIS